MKLKIQITTAILIMYNLSCGYMSDVSIYEPSKNISEFDQFPHKILFTSSEENGLWGIKNSVCKEVSFIYMNKYGRQKCNIKQFLRCNVQIPSG